MFNNGTKLLTKLRTMCTHFTYVYSFVLSALFRKKLNNRSNWACFGGKQVSWQHWPYAVRRHLTVLLPCSCKTAK